MINNDLLKKWTTFINSLEEKYNEEKEYFEAIKNVSEIEIANIDAEETREEIECNIIKIHNFLTRKQNYYELGNIKGFKSGKKISGRDYYYYIADQQMKATVYFARYLNFIVKSEIDDEYKKNVTERLKQYVDLLNICNNEEDSQSDVPPKCGAIISCIENRDFSIEKKQELYNIVNHISSSKNEGKDESTEEVINTENLLKGIQIELLRYKEEWEIASNIDYKIYMMLNNMLREIKFFGAAYQYLWHWNQHKRNLYRSGSLGESECVELLKNTSKKEQFKNIFEDCINHMNSPSNIRHSFSENLLLDIYKYLILKKTSQNENENITCKDGLSITCDTLKNDNEVDFYIIKNASLNSIFVEECKDISFYEYAVNDGYSDVAGYLVEMFPQDLKGERNSKGTVKGMRDTLLPIYFDSWGINASLSKTKVADDKEVITWGNCYKDICDIDPCMDTEFKFIDCQDGTLLKIKLKKNDILCLLLKIYQKKKKIDSRDSDVIEKVVEEIKNKMASSPQYRGKFSDFYEGKSNEWEQEFIFKCVDGNQFVIKIKANQSYKKFFSENEKVADAAEKMEENIKNNISGYLNNRYKEIISKNSKKADFILSTISDNEFNFELVSQYTEYLATSEDSEIAMLKYIIFKEA